MENFNCVKQLDISSPRILVNLYLTFSVVLFGHDNSDVIIVITTKCSCYFPAHCMPGFLSTSLGFSRLTSYFIRDARRT